MLTLGNAGLLLLAPAGLLLVAAAARRSAAALVPWRKAAALAARSLAVLLLTLALAGPVVTRRADRPFLTVFLADVSESVPRRAWDVALPALRRAWDREIAAGNRCALVGFAGRAEALVLPTGRPLKAEADRLDHRSAQERLRAAAEAGDRDAARAISELEEWTDRLDVHRTDFAAALGTARGLFQEESANRIVLVTDGRETGRAPAPPRLPPEALAVRLDAAARTDLAVVHVHAPLAVRTGEPFDIRVTVDAPGPGEVALSLAIDDVPEPVRRFPIASAGRTVLLLDNVQQRRPLAPGLRRLRVMASAPSDDEPRNDVGYAAVHVTGRPRVLLVEGTATEAEPLARLLQAQEIEFARESPGRLAARDVALEEFVCVVLAGVPRDALPAETVKALRDYVESSGGGLWVVGSPALQGPAGYAGTELERDLLPVRFAEATAAPAGGPRSGPTAPPPTAEGGTPKKVLAPTVALLFIVDKSGSMAGNNMALVKEAVIASAATLSAKDSVGVLAFDARPRWVVRFTEADRHDTIRDLVLRLYADGGTAIYPALAEALHEFRADPRARRAGIKHAILLSDGDTFPGDFETVTRALAEDKVTVTTVCVAAAPRFDAHLMRQIATLGKGRFLFADSFKQVPQIFTLEAQRVVGEARRDEPAPPEPPPPDSKPPDPGEGDRPFIAVTVREDHEILQGVDPKGLPPLRGKLGAAANPGAVVPLATAEGHPVLALRRAGLGKTAVWTSDLSGRWSADWMAWKDSGKLFAQLVRHLSSAASDADLAGGVRVTVEGDRAIVRVAPGSPGETFSAASLPSREALPVSRDPEGALQVEVLLERPGAMQTVLLQLGAERRLLVGAVRPYEEEYAPADPTRDLFARGTPPLDWPGLEARLAGPRDAGERRVDLSPWLILAAILLLPLDVALRRFNP